MTRRRAERQNVRRWEGDVAEANDLDRHREWVVWGVGATAERAAEPERAERPGRPGNDIAEGIAAGADPEWAEAEERWAVIVEADEAEVDAWGADDASVRGYAPYLVEPTTTGADTEPMRGVLRGDRVRRRPFGASRPS